MRPETIRGKLDELNRKLKAREGYVAFAASCVEIKAEIAKLEAKLG